MNTFTIENETNNIMAHAAAEDAYAVTNALSFHTEAGLAELAANWPASRLIDIWNNLPGVTPVKKFTSREKAVHRIWSAIQSLSEPAPAAAPADVAPATETVSATEPLAGEELAASEQAPKQPNAPRGGSKTETVLQLLRREGGATALELMEATGWQAHSVRGFLAGTVRKKLGLALNSSKGEDGTRTYSLES